MEEGKFKSYRETEGLDSLFMEIQGYFDHLYQSVRERRSVESFAGMDMSQDNKKLTEILDKLNLGLDPLRKSEGEVREEHIIVFIDAVLELLTFIGNKGSIKDPLKAKIDTMLYKENEVFGRRNQRRDKLMLLLSVAGTSLEVCSFNMVHTAIFALNAYLTGGMARSDQAITSDPRMVGIARTQFVDTLVEKTGRTPPQMFAYINRVRTYLLAAGLTFMTVNSFRSTASHHTLGEVISSVSHPSHAKIDARERTEFLLEFALSIIRVFLLTSMARRLGDIVRTSSLVDYAAYQRFKLGEFESERLDSSQLKNLKKLFLELQAALKRMSKDDGYDPTPLIEKIKEGFEAVVQGQTVYVKDFLKSSRRIVHEDYKRKVVLRNTGKSDSAIRQGTSKKIVNVARFELPLIRKKLSREERKELYARNKAVAKMHDHDQPVEPVIPEKNSGDFSQVCYQPTNDGAETISGREQMIRNIDFHRTLDGIQFRKFLKAMSFQQTEGGKGSHEKYALEIGGGTLIVVLSRKFDRFNDNIIKNDILRKPPYLNPEWVYWQYCEQFSFPESISAYQKLFGKEFDSKNQPSPLKQGTE